jgi:hypothetical protein
MLKSPSSLEVGFEKVVFFEPLKAVGFWTM